ncbi:MAG: sulfotransferase domain-containing protein [Phycisphaerales bacterium]
MMGINWLASYPKSGNTWVRFLLYSVMHGPPAKSVDIARKIPDIHRPLPFDPPETGPMLAKTHFACSPKHPKIDQSERAVLITRDPRDVLFSALNYRRLSGLTAQQMSDEQYARKFIAAGGDPVFLSLGYGTWRSHIESWQSQTDFPVHTVRYEDLKADPSANLSNILAFLGIEADDGAIDGAVRASSFESMRAMEIREKHQGAKGGKAQTLFVGTEGARQSGTYFMNTGGSGQTLTSISPALERAFNDVFSGPMEAHGYRV